MNIGFKTILLVQRAGFEQDEAGNEPVAAVPGTQRGASGLRGPQENFEVESVPRGGPYYPLQGHEGTGFRARPSAARFPVGAGCVDL